MVAGGQHTYRRIQFETASPAELILRLYDALARDLERAEASLGSAALEEAHAALIHAQEIVIELLASLDMSAGELSQQLADLYQYWYQRLVQANPGRTYMGTPPEPLLAAWARADRGAQTGAIIAAAAAASIRRRSIARRKSNEVVPGGGLEPPHLAAADFESAASTDSAIPARRQGA